MSRVLVVGGFGFYGRKVAAALRARGHELGLATRRPGGREGAVGFDLDAPESFAITSEYDVVVNCSDSVNAPPDAAVRHVLAHGGTWMEMSAHLPTIERLLAIADEPGVEAVGTVIVGVGVFPGLSTVLAKAVAEQGGACEQIELGIRISPLSGAGPGNCALMAESLFIPALRYEHGHRVLARGAFGPGAEMSFEGEAVTAINFALPDTELIRRCTGAPSVIARFALVPGWLRLNFALLAWFARMLRPLKRPVAWLLTWQMIALRAWLLRKVESRVQLVALADRGTERERSRELSFADGQSSTAAGVVAAVEAWTRREPERRPAGVFGVGECFELDELLAWVEV